MQQNHKQYYNINKQILYKPFRNCWIKTSKRALGSSLHFLTVQRRLEWIILTIWIAQFILFLFCNELTKNNYGVHTFTAKPPHFPLYKPICFSWTTPPSSPLPTSECTYFMDDPEWQIHPPYHDDALIKRVFSRDRNITTDTEMYLKNNC